MHLGADLLIGSYSRNHRVDEVMNRRRTAPTLDLPFWLICTLIPLGIFSWFFHWQILLPTHVTWLLQGDWGTNLLGWNALRHDIWRWPLGTTTLIAWPTGAAVNFTDSAPLLCLLLKPFAAILPQPFQFTGAWLLLCIFLQFGAAFLLLRPHAHVRTVAIVGAALLTLMPTLLIRVVHPCLFAQWTILLCLHAFINVENARKRDYWYASIFLLTALIHPYLLLMNAGIWGSDVLRRGFGALRAKNYAELTHLVGRSILILICPVAAIWATSGLSQYHSGAGGFGLYSMSIDALVNPGLEGYSRILRARPQGKDQIYEGFQYLGFGLLAVFAASGLALLIPQGRAQLQRMNWLAWLTPALLVLTAFALSDDIQFHGRIVAHVSYDWLPFNLPEMFRASGRMFWPCAYALAVAALQIVFALPRAFPLVVTLTALLLQACDLTAFAADIRSQTKAASSPNHFSRTPSPLWEPLVSSARIVEFQPPIFYVDTIPFYEIAWRATSVPRPVNIAYTARVNPRQAAIEKASRERFIRGDLDPTRLYVLLDGCVPIRIDSSLVRELDGLVIIPPADALKSIELGAPKQMIGRSAAMSSCGPDTQAAK